MDAASGNSVVLTTLSLFAVTAIWSARRTYKDSNSDNFLVARGSSGFGVLAWSFFASGVGGWLFFGPTQYATSGGIMAVIAYGVSCALPLFFLAWVGPLIRQSSKDGVTLTDWILQRYGVVCQMFISLVSIAYMLVSMSAELTAIGNVVGWLTDAHRLVVIISVACVTAVYTTIGGLQASLFTDQVQGYMVTSLLVVVCTVCATTVTIDPKSVESHSELLSWQEAGWASWIILCISNVSANFFHEGYWQRVWSAQDVPTLRRACFVGGVLLFVVVSLSGVPGLLAIWANKNINEDGSNTIFTILLDTPMWTIVICLILAVTMNCSAVDSCQNGLVAALSRDVFRGRVSIHLCRLVSMLVNVPAVIIAVQGYNVLQLFLAADLICACVVVPMFMGLIPYIRTTSVGVICGSLCGMASAVVWAVVHLGTGTSFSDACYYVTVSCTNCWQPFLIAPAGSIIFCFLFSLLPEPNSSCFNRCILFKRSPAVDALRVKLLSDDLEVEPTRGSINN